MVDGANAWQRFWRVTLPQLKPALFTVLTLGLIGCWQVFDQIYTGTKGQPAKTTLTPAYLSYDASFLDQDWGQGAAIAFILFAIIVLLAMFQRWVLRDRPVSKRRARQYQLPSRPPTASPATVAANQVPSPPDPARHRRRRAEEGDEAMTVTPSTRRDTAAPQQPPRSPSPGASQHGEDRLADRALRAARRHLAHLHLSLPRSASDLLQDGCRCRSQPGLAHSADLVDRGLRAAVPAQRLPGVVHEFHHRDDLRHPPTRLLRVARGICPRPVDTSAGAASCSRQSSR